MWLLVQKVAIVKRIAFHADFVFCHFILEINDDDRDDDHSLCAKTSNWKSEMCVIL